MTTTDLAALVVIMLCFAAFVVLLVAVLSMLRSLRDLREALDQLRGDVLPAVAQLRDTAARAGAEVERIDELLDTAESISATVEGASRIGYLAFRRPLVKVVALFRGVVRGLWRLVGGGRRPRGVRPVTQESPPPATPTDLRDRRRSRGRAA